MIPILPCSSVSGFDYPLETAMQAIAAIMCSTNVARESPPMSLTSLGLECLRGGVL